MATSSNQKQSNSFGARDTFDCEGTALGIYRLSALEKAGLAPGLARMPYSIRILLEAVLRNCDGFAVTDADVRRLARWNAKQPEMSELPFNPARVILQDFTGVPVLVDIAAMRAAVQRLGGDPRRINPLVPVDLVVDHSVQVDHFGAPGAQAENLAREFRRNGERYEFLRWGQSSVQNFRVVPPATGIVHQVNLEYLAQGVVLGRDADGPVAYPDTLVGTDSHTTMINGLGVLGWGVGGIEAEAAMLGQPMFMLTPQVVGVRLKGTLPAGVTATDLVLTITQVLRKKGVVDKFVEFYGPALAKLSLADRATVANMAPEYGATMGFFPTDATTVAYLRRTGRTDAATRVERYTREQGLFWTADAVEPEFSDTVEIDLSAIEASMAGPKRPQDRVALREMRAAFRKALTAPVKDRGFGLAETELGASANVERSGTRSRVGHGAVVIAAITSCTNTSNPGVMLAAGLLARNAVKRGLRAQPWVKTSLAPGSRVVTDYYRQAGLLGDLEQLGFHVVGYGCTTCIGNSGPVPDEVSRAVSEGNLVAAAVLSGNRNFEGRVHPIVKANYLASPPLVVAYALAGTVDIDLASEPVGTGSDGKPVYLRDIWPSDQEVAEAVERSVTPAMFEQSYRSVFAGTDEWARVATSKGDLYEWTPASTYIQEPPFFQGLSATPAPLRPIENARVLALLGDSVTTDHISPAGDIAADSPAAKYLETQGVRRDDYNSYGSRRGNDRVMVRGTFANIRLKNLMVPTVEGGVTVHVPSGERLSIFEAAERYRAEGTPLVVIAGKEYGTGSSRDWAAKGTLLLGVRAVIAESFERIHRANLVGMGVLPLVFENGQNAEMLGLTGSEMLSIPDIDDRITARSKLTIRVRRNDGSELSFAAIARLDTPIDVEYYRNGGILQTVLRKLLAS